MGNLLTNIRVVKELSEEVLVSIPRIFARMMFPAQKKLVENAKWWQNPGLSIQYQIEFRPGLE